MNPFTIEARAKGKVKLKVLHHADGTETELKFSNVLLDGLFTRKGANLSSCYVGPETSVSQTDTSITSIAQVNIPSGYGSFAWEVVGSQIVGDLVTEFTYGTGAVVGTISCMGIGSTTNPSTDLCIKTLLQDVNGDPTSITLLATDQLIVEHTLTLSLDNLPPAFNLEVDGVTYSVQQCSAKLGLATSAAYRTLYPFMPYMFHSSTVGGGSFARVIVAEGANLPDPGDTTSNVTLIGSSAVLTSGGMIYDEVDPTTWDCYVPGTMDGTTNLSNDADIGFIGWCQSSSSTIRTYGGYLFTPGLPKDSGIAYDFQLNFKIVRG